jgi:phosphoribosyl 1,2-cyclic phosphodiesterase
MKLHVLGSGSSGNCYHLKPKKGKELLIECGLTFAETKKGLNYKLDNIAGCLLSHEHKSDHARCPQDLINAGIPVYMSFGTASALNLKNPTCLVVGDIVHIGEFQVKAFDVEHDAKQPFGFIIYHPEMGIMLFATDTNKLDYQIDDVNHWLIEANYSEDIMLDNIVGEKLNSHLAARICHNHMSIESCITTLKTNDLSKTKTITLIHLSSINAWGDVFQDMVMRELAIKPSIAKQGLKIEL